MDKTGKLTRKEVAKRFGVSVSAVRAWQREFSQWLEVEPQKPGGGRYNVTTYSLDDMRVFAIVQRLTGKPDNMTYDEVSEVMDKELAMFAVDDIPAGQEPPPDVEQSTALVPWTQFSAVVASLQNAEGKLEVIEEERDWLRERLDEERERLEAKINTLEAKLNEERARSWLDKLLGRRKEE